MDIFAAFTASDILAIITAVGVLVGLIGTNIVNVVVSMRTSKEVAKVASKTDVIEGHVNSAASASAAQIEALLKEVRTLTAQLADKEKAAALAQQALATTAAAAAASKAPDVKPEPIVPKVEP